MATGLLLATCISGCGSTPTFSRDAGGSGGGAGSMNGGSTGNASGGGSGGGSGATGGVGGGGNGTGSGGAGGSSPGSGGAAGNTTVASGGSGGLPGSGGNGPGGSGGTATGGAASGGTGSGGMAGRGGSGGQAGSSAPGSGGMGGAVPVQCISIDFVGGPSTATVVMGPTEIAGVVPVQHWNSAAGNRSSLNSVTSSTGANLNVTVGWSSSSLLTTEPMLYHVGYTDKAGDTRMMNGYLDPTVASAELAVNVNNLPLAATSSGYDVYVYFAGNLPPPPVTTRTYHYAISGQAFSVLQTGAAATTFPSFALATDVAPGNYVVFRKMSAASFTLVAQPGAATATDPGRSPLNGLQIAWPAAP